MLTAGGELEGRTKNVLGFSPFLERPCQCPPTHLNLPKIIFSLSFSLVHLGSFGAYTDMSKGCKINSFECIKVIFTMEHMKGYSTPACLKTPSNVKCLLDIINEWHSVHPISHISPQTEPIDGNRVKWMIKDGEGEQYLAEIHRRWKVNIYRVWDLGLSGIHCIDMPRMSTI